MIPESFIRDLLDRVDIVDVISRVVTLKKKGINWFGLCPFHHEKTGSFSVNQNKQFYKCFGCGAHGNAIGFLMQYKGISYPEAIRELAAEAGMAVPEEAGRREKREKAASLTELMGKAQEYYALQLRRSQAAKDYLQGRQISEATQAKFGLGYSPDEWQALQAVFGPRYADAALESCGLVISKDGHRYDRFRGRVMFPIRNPRGQVIGFGARIMGPGEPKYLNSPETEIFRKGQEVYGLWEGREAIRKAGRAIVCEGYMDVIQLSQAGYGEAVAALGTAIGQAHIKKLFKLAPLIYFSFDGDDAGRHAARRALEQALPVIEDNLEARFVLLPPEHDPDSLIKEEGPEAYERELGKSFTLSSFFLSSLRAGKAMTTPEGRAKFLSEAKPLLQSMTQAPALRFQLAEAVAEAVRMMPEDACRLLGIPGPARSAPARPQEAPRAAAHAPGARSGLGARPVRHMREKMLRCMLAWPSIAGEFSGEFEEYVAGSEDPEDLKLLEVWRACAGGEDDPAPASSGALLERLRGSEAFPLYQELVDKESTVETPVDAARNMLALAFCKIRRALLAEKVREAAAASPLDSGRLAELLRQQQEANEEHARLSRGTQAPEP